jgi:hypothetical protein
VQLDKPLLRNPVAGARPIDLTLNQPRIFQHLQVLRDGCLGERHLVDDLAAEAGLAGEQDAQDLNAGRMSERLRE